MTGYLLIKYDSNSKYRGVDRARFEPLLIDEEINPNNQITETEPFIWKFYPLGWRREAYHIFEDNQVNSDEYNDVDMIDNLDAAFEIQKIIKPHLGLYEIIKCAKFELEFANDIVINEKNFIGFDLAYPGGDLYSAIKNGLFINPDPKLVTKYDKFLNEYGLFPKIDYIIPYLKMFQKSSVTECNSKFCGYALNLVFVSIDNK
jgi:hypothetical protein